MVNGDGCHFRSSFFRESDLSRLSRVSLTKFELER